MAIASQLVQAAEQIIQGTGRGAERLAWVEERLAQYGLKLDMAQLRDLVEAQVWSNINR